MTTAIPRTRVTSAREPLQREAPPSAASTHGRTRVRKSTDKYYIDPSIIPDGEVYQWKRWTVMGQEDPGYMAELDQVGFRPVPAERHPGVFLPVGSKGSIIIGGQILMERPVELEMEARWEDKQRADAQVEGSKEQFGLKPRAPGFEGPSRHQSARNNTYIRTDIERAPAGPKHDIDIDG